MTAKRQGSVKRLSRSCVVRDRSELADLVTHLVNGLGKGRARVAAQHLRVSSAMLSVLKLERRAGISVGTWRALQRGIYALARQRRRRRLQPAISTLLRSLERAVAYPTQDEARADASEAWCEERAEQLIRRRGDRWELGDEGPNLVRWSEQLDGDAVPLVDDAPLLSRLVELLRRDEYRELLRRARRSSPKFDTFCAERRPAVSPARRLVAIVRILEPLLEVAESGLLERRWQDLDDQELAVFVNHGLKRERILLR
jgi:hypothetical protein